MFASGHAGPRKKSPHRTALRGGAGRGIFFFSPHPVFALSGAPFLLPPAKKSGASQVVPRPVPRPGPYTLRGGAGPKFRAPAPKRTLTHTPSPSQACTPAITCTPYCPSGSTCHRCDHSHIGARYSSTNFIGRCLPQVIHHLQVSAIL